MLVKIQISTGKTKRIILKGIKKIDYYYIILGLIDIALSCIGQLINGNFEKTIFWFLLGLAFILIGFFFKGESVLINQKGIKINRTRIIKWNSIENIEIDELRNSVIKIETIKLKKSIDLYNLEKITDLKIYMHEYSPTTYKLLLK